MAIKIRKASDVKRKDRHRRKVRVRSKISGTAERPRLCLFRSNQHIYAQLIDDVKGATLASASTVEEELKGKTKNIEGARQVGSLLAKRALAKSFTKVVFDRSGYIYHGRVKALAEGAREAGLVF